MGQRRVKVGRVKPSCFCAHNWSTFSNLADEQIVLSDPFLQKDAKSAEGFSESEDGESKGLALSVAIFLKKTTILVLESPSPSAMASFLF